VPRNAQFPAWTNTLCENSTTSHAFECDWLQWCKKRQDELGMEPDPYLTHAERQYLSANPPRNDNCLEKCIELKEHAEKTNQGQVSCDKANLDYFLQIALCRLN